MILSVNYIIFRRNTPNLKYDILKLSLVKEFHNFIIFFEIFDLKNQDPEFIKTLQKLCYNDPTNPNLLNSISVEILFKKRLNLSDSELLLKKLSFIKNLNFSNKNGGEKTYLLTIFNLNLPLTEIQLLRLYNFISSYVKNYIILDAILRIYLNKEKELQTDNDNFIKQIDQIELKNNDLSLKSDENIEKAENYEFIDQIFDCCTSQIIKRSLIHFTFNYFQYVYEHVEKEIDLEKDKIKLKIPILFAKDCDIIFVENLFNHIEKNIQEDELNHLCKILLNMLINKNLENKLYILMIVFLIYLYFYKLIFIKIKNSQNLDSFLKIIRDPNIQTKIYDFVLKTYFSPFYNKINIQFFNIDNFIISDEYFNQLKSKYSHLELIPDELVNSILNDIKNKKNSNFHENLKITNKKIIEIDKLILEENKNQEKKYDLKNFLTYYKISDNIISYPYLKFIEYIKNNSLLANLLSNEEIPSEIVKFFPQLKLIINSDNFKKENISTFEFYKILVDKIKTLIDFDFEVSLFIIFQIIIPFYYDNYKTKSFFDILL